MKLIILRLLSLVLAAFRLRSNFEIGDAHNFMELGTRNAGDGRWMQNPRRGEGCLTPYPLVDRPCRSSSLNGHCRRQSLEFVRGRIRPWLVCWEQALTRDLIPAEDRDTYFDEFLIDGLTHRAQWFARLRTSRIPITDTQRSASAQRFDADILFSVLLIRLRVKWYGNCSMPEPGGIDAWGLPGLGSVFACPVALSSSWLMIS